MRLAVISDVHNNLAALEAVLADLARSAPDAVVVAGDSINRGPQPAQVLARLRAAGWPLLRGNHEDYVLAQMEPMADSHPDAHPIWQPARWTARQLPGQRDYVASLPLTLEMQAPDGSPVLVVHGTPLRNNEGVFAHTTDRDLRALLGPSPPRLLVCAHTHVGLVRRLDRTLVVNSGSVGLPFNGDARAQYAVLTWQAGSWQAQLRAVPYDRAATYQAFTDSGFLKDGGPLARVIILEVETARPHLGPWVRHFSHDVRLGQISVVDAVERYMGML